MSLLSGSWVVTIALATWVAYWYPAWWLVGAAILLDGYLGQFATVPYVTIAMGSFAVLAEVLKLQLVSTNTV